jgi:hypothetical protein
MVIYRLTGVLSKIDIRLIPIREPAPDVDRGVLIKSDA